MPPDAEEARRESGGCLEGVVVRGDVRNERRLQRIFWACEALEIDALQELRRGHLRDAVARLGTEARLRPLHE